MKKFLFKIKCCFLLKKQSNNNILCESNFIPLFCRLLHVNNLQDIDFIEHKGRNNIVLDDNIHIQSINVKHGTMKPCFGYIINIDGKSIGFSGDSIYCKAIDKIAQASDVSILDMSLKGDGDNSHMGFLDIKEICKKYPNKKIVATHMHNSTREVALNNPIKNLIIPTENFEIKL